MGIALFRFDLWDKLSEFLEGHFVFMTLMSFLHASPFGGRKGSEAETRLCLQDLRLCTEVPVLGKVTGRGHLVETKNTTTHFCKSPAHEQTDFLVWEADC